MSGYLTDGHYRTVYSAVPRLCVDLVARLNGSVLLLPRVEKPDIGSWHLPGGRVRIRETIAEAAARIAKRELRADITVGKCLGFMEFLHDVGDLGDFHSVSIVLEVKITNHVLEHTVSSFAVEPEPMLETHRAFLLKHGLLLPHDK